MASTGVQWLPLALPESRVAAARQRYDVGLRAVLRGEVQKARHEGSMARELLDGLTSPDAWQLRCAVASLCDGRRPLLRVAGVDSGARAAVAWAEPLSSPETLLICAGDKARFPERIDLFFHTLRDALRGQELDLVVYERARFLRGIETALQLGGYYGAIELACVEVGVVALPVDPSEVKKWATGSGVADKAAMQKAAVERFGAEEGIGEDEADAVCMWAWGLERGRVGGVA